MIARSAFLMALCLGGCAAFEGPQPNETAHTICYTRLETSMDQVRTLARQACQGSEPHFAAQEMDLSACPILVPERVYFSCGGS
jgi:hypothetical protein